MALARFPLQADRIHDFHAPTREADQLLLLKPADRQDHAADAHAERSRELLVRKWKHVRINQISGHQKPAGASLLKKVSGTTLRASADVREIGLRVSEHDLVKRTWSSGQPAEHARIHAPNDAWNLRKRLKRRPISIQKD